jgi:hypothetical protein
MRQRMMHFILEDIGNGLLDHQIMDKRGIRARTYYKYKKILGKQCKEIQSKISEEDISLAAFMLEHRLTRYLLAAEKKLEGSGRDSDPDYFAIATDLAVKLFTLKRDGLIAAVQRNNNNNLSQEQPMTTAAGDDEPIWKINMNDYKAEVMRTFNLTSDEEYKEWVLAGNKLPPAPERRPPTMYSEQVKHVFGLTD